LRGVAKWVCLVVLLLAMLASVATRLGGFVWGHDPFMLIVDRGQGVFTVRVEGNGFVRSQFHWRHPPAGDKWSWLPVTWNRQSLMTEKFVLVRFWLATPLMSLVFVVLALWWPEVRAVLRRRAGRCAACGYDRNGLGAGATCPECGAAATVLPGG
jgi:hypothetical protein